MSPEFTTLYSRFTVRQRFFVDGIERAGLHCLTPGTTSRTRLTA